MLLTSALKSVDLCLENSDIVFTESQYKTSQLIQTFCEEATKFAPLCGMMLGRLAAPLVRFHSARIFSPLLGNTTSHIASWFLAMSTEGFCMTATPGVLQGNLTSADLWRGTSHATVMMMVCEGISKRVPLGGGVLAACGQDLGVILVNYGFGEAGITDKVNGGIVEQWAEARLVAIRMKVSAGVVGTVCVETSYVSAKYELKHNLEKSVLRSNGRKQASGGFWNVMPETIASMLGVVRGLTPEGAQIEIPWETPTEKVIRGARECFMAENGDGSESPPTDPKREVQAEATKAEATKAEPPLTLILIDSAEFAKTGHISLSDGSSLPPGLANGLRTILGEPSPLRDLFGNLIQMPRRSLIISTPSIIETLEEVSPNLKTQILELTMGEYRAFSRESRSTIADTAYQLVSVTNEEIADRVNRFIEAIPSELQVSENLDYAYSPFSNNNDTSVSHQDFSVDFGETVSGRKFDKTASIKEALQRFNTSRLSVTTTSGMHDLTQMFLTFFPETHISKESDRKTVLTIPTSTGLDYTFVINTNRVMARVNPEDGISMRELLRLQDEQNDFAAVLLVKWGGEKDLIVRGAAARGGLPILEDDTLIAHTHPWIVDDFLSLTPGESEITLAQKAQNTQVGIYRKGMVIFHYGSQVFRTKKMGEYARRGKVSFIPFSGEEDFVISERDNNVSIQPGSQNPVIDKIRLYPTVEVIFRADGQHIFTDGEKEIDQSELLRWMKED